MKIVGLTGSIAMGKSTAAELLKRDGIPLYDADAEVHRLMASGGAAVKAVLEAFPGVGSVEQGIDRQKLGAKVFGDPTALRRLEGILHPRVGRSRKRFLQLWARQRRPVVVLDIPLLFETGGEKTCDAVVVVSAPAFLQRQRALSRRGMTEAKLTGILSQQTPDREKRRRADVVVNTGSGKRAALRQLRRAISEVKEQRSRRRKI
jgi:dephospho-CoA kinase